MNKGSNQSQFSCASNTGKRSVCVLKKDFYPNTAFLCPESISVDWKKLSKKVYVYGKGGLHCPAGTGQLGILCHFEQHRPMMTSLRCLHMLNLSLLKMSNQVCVLPLVAFP